MYCIVDMSLPPRSITVMYAGSTWVQVTWSPVVSNITSSASILYNVTGTTTEGVVILRTQEKSSTSAILTGLQPNTYYIINIITLTRIGSVEVPSAPIMVLAFTGIGK